jgi:hypothetical protein
MISIPENDNNYVESKVYLPSSDSFPTCAPADLVERVNRKFLQAYCQLIESIDQTSTHFDNV